MGAPLDAAQLQALIDVLTATANAQAAVARAAVAAAAVPPAPIQVILPPAAATTVQPFSLLPGASGAGSLDFTKPESTKLFNKAIFAIDPKLALEESKLRMFLKQIQERARIYNWSAILSVEDASSAPRNIITSYGQLTVEYCARDVVCQYRD
jgi:hypothetical protein